jgi:hypothetical protein
MTSLPCGSPFIVMAFLALSVRVMMLRAKGSSSTPAEVIWIPRGSRRNNDTPRVSSSALIRVVIVGCEQLRVAAAFVKLPV